MTPIAAHLDHFVRWFFNSSPTRIVELRTAGSAHGPGTVKPGIRPQMATPRYSSGKVKP